MIRSGRKNDTPGRAAGQSSNGDVSAQGGCGCGEIIRLVERTDLCLVGKKDVDMPFDESAKCGAMPSDAERVGEAQCRLPPRRVGNPSRLAKGLLREWRVEQVTLEICNSGRGDDLRIDVAGPEFGGRAEIGVHRALPVRSDEDQATRCAGTVGGCWRVETHA